MTDAALLFEAAAKRLREEISSAATDYQRRLESAYSIYTEELNRLTTEEFLKGQDNESESG